MKILLDACVWGKAKERLIQEGHDVVWAGDWLEDPLESGASSLKSGVWSPVSDWRVIYEISKKAETIFIHKIGHRKDIYK